MRLPIAPGPMTGFPPGFEDPLLELQRKQAQWAQEMRVKHGLVDPEPVKEIAQGVLPDEIPGIDRPLRRGLDG